MELKSEERELLLLFVLYLEKHRGEYDGCVDERNHYSDSFDINVFYNENTKDRKGGQHAVNPRVFFFSFNLKPEDNPGDDESEF